MPAGERKGVIRSSSQSFLHEQVLEIAADHPQRSLWKDLCTLVVLTCSRTVGDRESCETRLYLSSHKPKARPLATAIRKHWSIENT